MLFCAMVATSVLLTGKLYDLPACAGSAKAGYTDGVVGSGEFTHREVARAAFHGQGFLLGIPWEYRPAEDRLC